jgi:hypothetical protein
VDERRQFTQGRRDLPRHRSHVAQLSSLGHSERVFGCSRQTLLKEGTNMKKSVIITALGFAAGVMTSFGQGSMTFNSYTAGPSSTGVKIYDFNGTTSTPLAAGFTADLVWSLTPINESEGNGALAAGWVLSGSGAPSVQSMATPFDTAHPGYFQGANNFILNPYTPGTTVYFEVIAYQTFYGSYANAGLRGHSASFSTTLTTGTSLPPNMPLFQSFSIDIIPEPTTLALAGLGLVVFVAYRGKYLENTEERL